MDNYGSEHLSYELKGMDSIKREIVDLVNFTYEKSKVSKKSDFRILDVGCGRGELTNFLFESGYKVHGVDIDKTCVKLTNRKRNLAIQLKAEDVDKKMGRQQRKNI